MSLTREQILGRKVAGRTLEVQLDLDDPDTVVVVRGMSRGEAATMRDLDQADVVGLEAYALSMCLIEPTLSVDEARAWLEGEGNHTVQRAIDAVQQLSGAAPGQAKEYTKSVSRRRRATR